MPWIQADDLVRLIEAVRENASAEGPVNAVAPEAVRNRDFVAAIARRLGRPAVTPLPAFVVRAVLGELAGEFLASRRVVPERAAALGFRFLYPDLERALAEEI
jgi:NAD dependent epimerase/dehydratase family enzyme